MSTIQPQNKHGGRREGAGRRCIGASPTVQRNISMPVEDWDKLDSAAKAAGKTRSELAREIFSNYFDLIDIKQI